MKAFKCDVCGRFKEGEPAARFFQVNTDAQSFFGLKRYTLEIKICDVSHSTNSSSLPYTADDICLDCRAKLFDYNK